MKNNLNRILIALFLLLFYIQNSVGQDREVKTNVIIDSLKTVEFMKSTYIEFRLEPLKFEAINEDSIKLCEIENFLTDKEIRSRIVRAFDILYTDKEINDLYNFVGTTAFTKLVNSTMNMKISEQFNDIVTDFERIEKNIKQQNEIAENSESKFEPIYIDREDGFYETVDYDSNKKIKDIKLVKNPSIPKTEISEIKKSANRFGDVYIEITFSKEGAKLFYLLTKKNIGKPIAIIVDKHIVSAPTVNSEISGGRANISGNFTTEEIDKMIEKLKNK